MEDAAIQLFVKEIRKITLMMAAEGKDMFQTIK